MNTYDILMKDMNGKPMLLTIEAEEYRIEKAGDNSLTVFIKNNKIELAIISSAVLAIIPNAKSTRETTTFRNALITMLEKNSQKEKLRNTLYLQTLNL